MQAAGMYLRALREHQHMSRFAVAVAAGTNESQIVRIEAGGIDTRGSLLMRIAEAVQADAQTLMELLIDESRTVDEARLLAEAQFTAYVQQRSPSQRRAIAARLRQLADDLDNQRGD